MLATVKKVASQSQYLHIHFSTTLLKREVKRSSKNLLSPALCVGVSFGTSQHVPIGLRKLEVGPGQFPCDALVELAVSALLEFLLVVSCEL
ncbi:hypothetical protein AXG93_3986s1120 [Marchantia polymorpha subsp. ruderalis]|uniref:Uncharacterized protein n=1 Tax=Marchantia polymorpha subsp. ruderalis TaxID=1480154 RepID=A0A176VR30_MARPO|nr:hypothetical protein AXG93_3986s1120 [Marchantia polymorpha subsp. ruderalis]